MPSTLRTGFFLLWAVISTGISAQQSVVDRAVTADSTLGQKLATAAEEATVSCELGVYVVETTGGREIINLRGDEMMIPASCNKLQTTAVGLSVFGPEHRFTTSVYADGQISDGTLEGDLIIYGTGDPTIGGRFQEDKKDITLFFRQWAKKLKDAGITRITGSVIADDSYFDDDYFHKNWYPRERAEWYSAEVGALSFNDNCIDVSWDTNGVLPGTTLKDFVMNPVTKYGSIEPGIRTVAKGRPWEITYLRDEGSNEVLATGTLVVDHKKNDSAAIHDPALYTVTVLTETLTSEGLTIQGNPRKVRQLVAEKKPKLLFEHKSETLTEVVNIINRNSQNFYAECLLKALGKQEFGKGTYVDGSAAVTKWLKDNGIYEDGHVIVDGSGMAGENKVSPRMLIKIMDVMDKSEHREVYRTSLPVGGISGSIRTRFRDTPETIELGKRIRAKTGGIGGVRTLSGIVTDNGGTEYYFSVMLNRLRDHTAGTALIDQLVIEMARHSDS